MIFLDQRISAQAAVEAAKTIEPETAEVHAHPPLWKPVTIFAVATAVIVFVGPMLAETAGELAELSGLGKSFVGTTLVALCTSLPELVASITAIRMKAVDLVIGNVFGSNVFNMILFVPLDAIHDGSLLGDISPSHAITAMAVILATAVATLGQLYRVEKRKWIGEPDALLMLVILIGALVLIYKLPELQH
jgi:cation:H+ antiporter